MGKKVGWVAALTLGVSVISSSAQTKELFGPTLLAMQENDLIVRTDRHYTQGLKFNFMAREHGPGETDSWAVRWADRIPKMGIELDAARYGLCVGQNIYTPTDITATTLQVDDRPYAGFLHAGIMLQRRGVTEKGKIAVLDHLQLDLGVMGPPSMAEEAQNTVHSLRNFGLALGWGNQLTVEPGLAIRYARYWRYSTGVGRGWEGQIIPGAGLSLGNVGTYGMVGGQMRAGWHIPEDFGVQTVDSIVPTSGGKLPGDSTPRFGFYVFVGVEGRAVAHNPFLDGNLLHASHSVSKHPLVGDGKFGFVVAFRRCDLIYTQVVRSKEFVGQKETDAFGSLALKIKW